MAHPFPKNQMRRKAKFEERQRRLSSLKTLN